MPIEGVLRSRLGRIIRDIGRKIAGQPALEEAFAWPLARARQIRAQQQRQRGWTLYSLHAPEVERIGKSKARAPYEFGVKVSITTNNACATDTPRSPTSFTASSLKARSNRLRPMTNLSILRPP